MSDAPRFQWDASNTQHTARHGVSPGEAEEVILDSDAIMLEVEEEGEYRVKAVGRTRRGRILVAVFTFRGEAIRPITAYAATRRMEALYHQGKPI